MTIVKRLETADFFIIKTLSPNMLEVKQQIANKNIG